MKLKISEFFDGDDCEGIAISNYFEQIGEFAIDIWNGSHYFVWRKN